MTSKHSVLFLCTGNSCRSQMAEAFVRKYAADRLHVFSAGLNPAQVVHPLAVEVMAERGIDISQQKPKGVAEFLGRLSVRYLIIVCDDAEKNCPRIFPGAMQRSFWPFDDPAAFEGSQHATIEKFREVRDQIETQIKSWLIGMPE